MCDVPDDFSCQALWEQKASVLVSQLGFVFRIQPKRFKKLWTPTFEHIIFRIPGLRQHGLPTVFGNKTKENERKRKKTKKKIWKPVPFNHFSDVATMKKSHPSPSYFWNCNKKIAGCGISTVKKKVARGKLTQWFPATILHCIHEKGDLHTTSAPPSFSIPAKSRWSIWFTTANSPKP